ncbi:MAG: hypothetical protein ACRD44_01970, partial [Bryobacteraceae bacterium]
MKFMVLFPFFLSFTVQAAITPLSCIITAVPTLVRLEGLSERLGDINMACAGAPGGDVSAVLNIFLPANVTNRVSSGGALDVVMTVDLGSGPVSAGATPRLMSVSSLVFENISFTMPASGTVHLRISNLRVAAGIAGAERPITAFLSGNGPSVIQVQNNNPTIGIAHRGLFLGTSSTSIVCTGASLPSVTNFGSLTAFGARFFTARVTEGLTHAFEKRQPLTDSGVRVILRYSGFPPLARLLVPDVVAGSSALEPTSAGDFGLSPKGGKYDPGGTGSLLLARVQGADSTGTGGAPVFTPGLPGSGIVWLDLTSDVELTNGSGYVVYEVVDANPFATESAQIPTFAGIVPVEQPAVGRLKVTFAPV